MRLQRRRETVGVEAERHKLVSVTALEIVVTRVLCVIGSSACEL